jgi:hypothetical protein
LISVSSRSRLKLPHHDSLQELVERFSGQFTTKVANIQSMLDPVCCCHPAADTPLDFPSLSSFVGETVLEIVAVIKECPSKSSSFDRIPTSLVKKFAYFLAVLITDIVNMFLSLGVFPDEMSLPM